jgi:DNA-binding transcriptional MerR regulator
MRSTLENKVATLDPEWINLIKEAKDLGLSINEVQSYLRNNEEDKA